jgi:hypothetical protein
MGIEHGRNEHVAGHATDSVKMNAPGNGGFRHRFLSTKKPLKLGFAQNKAV